MASTLPGTQLTDMWMANPYMFDPSQQSNQFSNYNNQAMPFPPTYYGSPVNAATGQPIQSYQNWAQNPGPQQTPPGMTLNSAPSLQSIGQNNPQMGQLMGWQQLVNPEGYAAGNITGDPYLNMTTAAALGGAGGVAAGQQMIRNQLSGAAQGQGQGQGQAQGGAPGGAPNNWYAALSALANPGRVATPGATVPLQQGYQPSGGVNQAFLQSRGMGPGPTGGPTGAPMGGGRPVNQGFLNALQAIQNRPQQF